jgi:predicted Ser/Thr protein kinase
VAGNRDDELARTATALPSSSDPARELGPVGEVIGRYRLEREIGSGGMGAVHAAFDPDLERRVAVKVLRAGGGSGIAERRLLREARAMARLVHPNVVTVHEVGSAAGRDYIAMELVEGETLAEWLRARRRPVRAILDAFVGAGRGLAAAHAAGIVHRDFKPHNVLRSRGGRIVVTDFGLAREAEDADADAGAGAGAWPTDRLTPLPEGTVSTPLAGLTVTGSFLGTPAYMAPEQWHGGAVTPATDQFAFCVALWEALAGERPFRGPTVEALREEILRGPGALDDSKIPRRLRRVLRRGLDPEPARRWPSMDALLAAIARADRRPILAAAAVALALLAGAIAWSAFGRGAPLSLPTPAACPAPPLDPDAVWSAARRQALASRRGVEARMLDGDFTAWQAARARACTAGMATQTPQQVCLDAVLVRFDVIAGAVEQLAPDVPTVDPGAFSIDPAICEAPRPPRLVPAASPRLREVIATALRQAAVEVPLPRDAAVELVQRAAADPCAAAPARLLLAGVTPLTSERDRQLSDAEQDAERCNDDRVRAEVAIAVARRALTSSTLGTTITAKVKSADLAVEHVAQRDLVADIDALRLETARRADNLDEAIARGEAAVAGYAARGRTAALLAVGLELLDLRDLRASADDLAVVPRRYDEWHALAMRELGEQHPMVRKIEAELAMRMFVRGDVDGGHARLARLWRPIPGERARRVRGRVVDRRGLPVEGATVSAGRYLVGDALSAAVPFPKLAGEQRVATTGKTGEFEIPDAPPEGVVIAQLGEARSRPVALADSLTLALEPTSRIEGRIDLRGEPASRVIVSIQDLRLPVSTPYEIIAPVAPDGSFAVEGVPRAQVRVLAVLRNPRTRSYASATVDVRGPAVRGVAIAVTRAQRVVHVIVRSTVASPVANAEVYVFPGHRASTNALEMLRELRTLNEHLARQIEGEHAPPPVVARARAGDMFATMHEVPEGAATACAVGLPADLSDPELESKINANLAKIEIRCTPIPADAEAVVVEVPPWPRLP